MTRHALPSRLDGRRFEILLAAVVAAGLVVRVVYVLTVGRDVALGFDAVWYELQAGTLATGKGYIDPDAFYRLGQQVPTANFPPLWPLTLAAAHRMGVDTQTGYQLLGACIGTATVAFTGLLGRHVAGRRIGLVAAALVALCPLLIAADGSVMSESLYVALVTASLVAGYRALEQPNVVRFALVGALLGLASLTRSDGLILVGVMALALGWKVTPVSNSRRLALGGCVVVVALVVIAPWVVRSSSALDGTVVMSSNSGSMLEGANCSTTYAGPLLGGWDPTCLVETRAEGVPEVEWAAASRSAGIEHARSNALRLPLVGSARVLREWGIWAPADQARLDAIESRNETWQLVGWAYGAVLLVAAVPGAVHLVRRRAVLAPLAAVVVAVVITAAVSYGNHRFRLVAEPVVAIAAATAVVALLRGHTVEPRSRSAIVGVRASEESSDEQHP